MGYASVEAWDRGGEVIICTSETTRAIAHLGCGFENAEECWADMLPVISNVYVEGWQEGRSAVGHTKREEW